MSRIVVITHEFDEFLHPRRLWKAPSSVYLLLGVLRAMERRGHRWCVTSGLLARPGDVGILHVDSTRVSADYLALGSLYPIGVNFKVADISKRLVSGARLSPGDQWAGPVIIKTNLNYAGRPEAQHRARAKLLGRPPPHPGVVAATEYRVLPSMDQVPDGVWLDPDLVVDRFMPEPDPQGFGMRTWVFMGDRERCSRHVSPDPMVKAATSVSRVSVEIPEALRVQRQRLGFDYGKFDFVMHEGAPILLDANKTPGAPPADGARRKSDAETLAAGLEDLIKRSALGRPPRRGQSAGGVGDKGGWRARSDSNARPPDS